MSDNGAMMLADWAEAFLRKYRFQGRRTLHHWSGGFWLWEEGRPWYRRLQSREMWSRSFNWLLSKGKTADPRVGDDFLRVLEATCVLYGVERMPTWLGEDAPQEDPDGGWLALRNGILRPLEAANAPDKVKLLPHTPDWFSPTYLPYEYRPGAVNRPLQDWLSRRLKSPDKCALIQEWAGYLLTPDTSKEVCLLAQGPSGTGKSTLARLLVSLVGGGNTSHITLGQFGDDFILPLLEGKTFNWSDEVRSKLGPKAEEVLKMVVTGSPIQVRSLYEQYRTLVPVARVMATLNDWPTFHDSGFWRRILLIPMMDVIPREKFDRLEEDLLHRDQPGLLNWALQGLKRLHTAGWFTRVPEGEAILASRRDDVENDLAFAREGVVDRPGGFVTGDALYGGYLQWCKLNGYKPCTTQKGLKLLICREHPKAEQARRSHGRGISGISLVT